MQKFQKYSGEKFDFNEAEFNSLMNRRVYKVLIICSNYDFFMLEEDGRIDEQIFNEYVEVVEELLKPNSLSNNNAYKVKAYINKLRKIDPNAPKVRELSNKFKNKI